jgi:hypothetical protein
MNRCSFCKKCIKIQKEKMEVCAHFFGVVCYNKYRKTPPIHYIVFATPHKRNTFSKKKTAIEAVFFLPFILEEAAVKKGRCQIDL